LNELENIPVEESPSSEQAPDYTKNPGDKPDVLGLRAEFIYLMAAQAKVSRGKVRRVLKAFEPAFYARIQESHETGYNDGIDAVLTEIAQREQGAELEYPDDPEGSEGREEVVPA
jgi:hypothetical protein